MRLQSVDKSLLNELPLLLKSGLAHVNFSGAKRVCDLNEYDILQLAALVDSVPPHFSSEHPQATPPDSLGSMWM